MTPEKPRTRAQVPDPGFDKSHARYPGTELEPGTELVPGKGHQLGTEPEPGTESGFCPDTSRHGITVTAHWLRKFADAIDGLCRGARGESSLRVHFVFGLATLLIAAWLRLEAWRWGILGLCITVVIAAEYFNSSIEQLVRGVTSERRPEFAAALHLAAGGVLATAIGAAAVGLITLLPPLIERFFG